MRCRINRKHWDYEVVKEFVKGRETFFNGKLRDWFMVQRIQQRIGIEKEEGQNGLLDGMKWNELCQTTMSLSQR